jgi:hypothetical protein
MNALPPPGAGDNYYVICWNCGKISYANKSTAQYCQELINGKRPNCNPAFNQRGRRPSYDPTVTTCFGEQVNIDEVIAPLSNYYENGECEWTLPIPARMLFQFCKYHGPLPSGTEKVVVGGYAIRKVRRENIDDVAYQFKSYLLLTPTEREVRRNTIVRGLVTTFYKQMEDHPLHHDYVKDLSDSESMVHIDDICFWLERHNAIHEAKQQKEAATDVNKETVA